MPMAVVSLPDVFGVENMGADDELALLFASKDFEVQASVRENDRTRDDAHASGWC